MTLFRIHTIYLAAFKNTPIIPSNANYDTQGTMFMRTYHYFSPKNPIPVYFVLFYNILFNR